jgi:RHS repeat-associated protein
LLNKLLLPVVLLSLAVLALPHSAVAVVDVSSITCSGPIIGGSTQNSTVTVYLSGTAPYQMSITIGWGSGVSLGFIGLSGNSLIIPAGANSGTFLAYGAGVVSTTTNIQLSATYGQTVYGPLTINPIVLSLATGGTLVGGTDQQGTATVSFNVPTRSNAGVTLTYASSGYGTLCFLSDPNSSSCQTIAYIPAGSSSYSFPYISTSFVGVPNSETITATFGSDTATGSATILPDNPHLSISPSTIVGGSSETGAATVTLDVPVGARSSAYVSLSSFSGLYLLSAPNGYQVSSLSLGPGQSSGSFCVSGVSTTQIVSGVVTATLGTSSQAPVTILPLNPDSGPCNDCKNQTGQPISVTTGNTWVQQRDYSLPGLGGGLELTRTWNSDWRNVGPLSASGIFGDSWISTYEERLDTSGSAPLKYWRSDGNLWYFQSTGGNNYSLVFPPNYHATLTYSSATSTYTISFPEGSQRVFNGAGHLISLLDRNGNQTNVAYDAQGRLSTVTDPASRVLTFVYPSNTVLLAQSVKDATGTIATYAYDYAGRLSTVTYADNSFLTFNYDSNMLLLNVTDTNGKIIEAHTYDYNRRGLTSQKANGVDLVTLTYPSSTQTTVTDSLSHQSTYTQQFVQGRYFVASVSGPTCTTCGAGNTASWSYDGSGNSTSVTDANGYTTNYTYDAAGNVLTRSIVVNGAPLTWTYTYNSFDQVLTATDPLNFVTTSTYDTHGNLLTVTTPSPDGVLAGSVTAFTYDTKGELKTIKDPRNNVTTLAYYPTGLINTITDANNKVTTYTYDARGNRLTAKDALNNTTQFAYDPMNRLTKITYPDTTIRQFGYDARGRRTSVTDGNNKITTYVYDDADRFTSVKDAANNTTTYGYDTESNLTSITDANNNQTTFQYDPNRWVTQTTFPSTHMENYTYDLVGNLKTKTDRKNQTITYSYDPLNRLTQKFYPDSSSVTYTYDNDSRLSEVVDPTGTYQFTFDHMGRLIGTTTQYAFLSGRNFTTTYGYDAASNRTSFTDPESGSTSYAYDVLNRLTTLTPPTAFSSSGNFGFSYDAISRRSQLTRPNSVTTTYSYDTLSRLLSVLHKKASTTLDGASYTVDNAGNRLTRTPKPSGTASTFGYDNIYELLSVTQGSTTKESYTYDPVGNRLTALGSAPWSYNVSNELTARPSYTYTYDNNGNVLTSTTGSNTTNYTWDYENQMTSLVLPGSGGTVTFKYDPFGRRIYKSSSSGTSIFAYDESNLAEETNASGTAVTRYTGILDFDQPLAILRLGTTSYYEQDGLGSVTSLSNSSGSIAQTYTFDSFGNQTGSSGSLTNPLQYTARESDSETGLYYYRARYYNPTTGRFTGEDPLGFRAGANFYRYVRNNSVNLTDPTGLYSLQGFSPTQAAQMSTAIGQLAAKLKANPCCVDPKLRDRLLNLLQPGNYGSGVTFVYKETLPADPGYVTCAQVSNGWAFLTNTVTISKAALDGTCSCPLAGNLMHETIHLGWKNWFGSTPEGGAYGGASSCFGPGCNRPQGVTTP